MLYILTRVWVLRTPNAGQNLHFQQKSWKNEKKARNLQQNSSNNLFAIKNVKITNHYLLEVIFGNHKIIIIQCEMHKTKYYTFTLLEKTSLLGHKPHHIPTLRKKNLHNNCCRDMMILLRSEAKTHIRG